MISKIAAEYTGFSFLERIIFCIGSLLPDLSPMQFIHRHFYGKSGRYVQKKLERLSGRDTLTALLTYGKMAHYVSDFCCSVHTDDCIGNVREHIFYERALNFYILENYDIIKAECLSETKHTDLNSILSCYRQSQKYDLHTDLSFAVNACISICMKARLCTLLPAKEIYS